MCENFIVAIDLKRVPPTKLEREQERMDDLMERTDWSDQKLQIKCLLTLQGRHAINTSF